MNSEIETFRELQDYLLSLRSGYCSLEGEIARLNVKLKDNLAGQCEIENRITLLRREK